jgi:hypothetical protein
MTARLTRYLAASRRRRPAICHPRPTPQRLAARSASGATVPRRCSALEPKNLKSWAPFRPMSPRRSIVWPWAAPSLTGPARHRRVGLGPRPPSPKISNLRHGVIKRTCPVTSHRASPAIERIPVRRFPWESTPKRTRPESPGVTSPAVPARTARMLRPFVADPAMTPNPPPNQLKPLLGSPRPTPISVETSQIRARRGRLPRARSRRAHHEGVRESRFRVTNQPKRDRPDPNRPYFDHPHLNESSAAHRPHPPRVWQPDRKSAHRHPSTQHGHWFARYNRFVANRQRWPRRRSPRIWRPTTGTTQRGVGSRASRARGVRWRPREAPPTGQTNLCARNDLDGVRSGGWNRPMC